MPFLKLFKRKSSIKLTLEGDYSPIELANGVKNEEITIADIERLANSGNTSCQAFMAQGVLVGIIRAEKGDMHISEENLTAMRLRFIKFAEPAAASGHGDLQYNLGLVYIKVGKLSSAEYVTDEYIDTVKKAKYWYGNAASNPNCTMRSQAKKSAQEMAELLEMIE